MIYLIQCALFATSENLQCVFQLLSVELLSEELLSVVQTVHANILEINIACLELKP